MSILNFFIKILAYGFIVYTLYCIIKTLILRYINIAKIIDKKDTTDKKDTNTNNNLPKNYHPFNISLKRLRDIPKDDYNTIINNYILVTSTIVTSIEMFKLLIIRPSLDLLIEITPQISSTIFIMSFLLIMYKIANLKKHIFINILVIFLSALSIIIYFSSFCITIFKL